MSHLTPQQQELVAIGAALGSNCIPCMKFHVRKGLRSNLTGAMIAEAIAIADSVRRVPARNVRQAASAALDSERDECAEEKSACNGDNDGARSTGTAGASCCGPEADS